MMEKQPLAVSRQQSAPSGEKCNLYLTDVGRLNDIYQAAKRAVVQTDNFTLAALARAIHRAERVEPA